MILSLGRSYFRRDLCVFFPKSRSGMTCYSSSQDDDVSVFIFGCKFYSPRKQTHLQQHGHTRGELFPSPRFNLDTFGLEQRSVSIITFPQDAVLLIRRAQGVSPWARKLLS